MKGKVLKILPVVETIVIALGLFWFCFCVLTNKNTELFRENSPNGEYVLYIEEIGTSDWPFDADHLEITLYKNTSPDQSVSFGVDVRNDGAHDYEIAWLDNGVQIALNGEEQPTTYYILPFKTLDKTENVQESTMSEAQLTGEETTEEHEIYIPSRDEVLSAGDVVLEGMTQEQIDSLTENIKIANLTMENAYLNENIFSKLGDKDSLYWNYFDEKGEIQIGWEYDGEYDEIQKIMEAENLTREEFNEKYCEPLTEYNRFDADNFIELIEDMKKSVVNEDLQNDLQSIIDETRLAAETHEMEHANNIYKILHDMDYFLLRYGIDDVGKYTTDNSLVGTYYGTLSIYI